MEKYYKTSDVAKILGVHWSTVYRYIAQCSTCKNYAGVCTCKKPVFRLKAMDISPETGREAEWRIAASDLNDFIKKHKKRLRRKGRNGTE